MIVIALLLATIYGIGVGVLWINSYNWDRAVFIRTPIKASIEFSLIAMAWPLWILLLALAHPIIFVVGVVIDLIWQHHQKKNQ